MPQLSAAQRIHHNHINSFSFSRYTNNLVDHMILNRFSFYRRLHALAAHAFAEDDNDDSPASTRLPCWLWPAQNFWTITRPAHSLALSWSYPDCLATTSSCSGYWILLPWILDSPPPTWDNSNWQLTIWEDSNNCSQTNFQKNKCPPPPLKTLRFKISALKYLHSTMPDIYLP